MTTENFPTGAVRDQRTGKGRFDLLSPHVLTRDALLYEKGAIHYADRNWEKGMPFSRCIDSAMRHLVRWLRGDREEDHLAAVRFNVGAIMHYEEEIQRGRLDPGLDDIPNVPRVASVDSITESLKPFPFRLKDFYEETIWGQAQKAAESPTIHEMAQKEAVKWKPKPHIGKILTGTIKGAAQQSGPEDHREPRLSEVADLCGWSVLRTNRSRALGECDLGGSDWCSVAEAGPQGVRPTRGDVLVARPVRLRRVHATRRRLPEAVGQCSVRWR
jgi:hypothetical protein